MAFLPIFLELHQESLGVEHNPGMCGDQSPDHLILQGLASIYLIRLHRDTEIHVRPDSGRATASRNVKSCLAGTPKTVAMSDD